MMALGGGPFKAKKWLGREPKDWEWQATIEAIAAASVHVKNESK